jgi:hypothetical protein
MFILKKNIDSNSSLQKYVSEICFRTTQELEYLFILSRIAHIFFQNLTLGYMTKTLNQIFFFPPLKSEYFFQQHWESGDRFTKGRKS